MKDIKAPNIVIIGVLTIITIVFWIIYGVYQLVTTPQDVKVESSILEPVSPTLNSESLANLEGRIYFTESQIGQTVIELPEEEESPTPSPSPTPEADEEVATQSGETNDNESTESGELAQ